MTSLFVAKKLYTETQIKDFITNCNSEFHEKVYHAIYSYAQNTKQSVMPFSNWIKEYESNLSVIGNTSPGDYIKSKIYEDYNG